MAIWHGATAYFGTIYGLEGPTDNDGKSQAHWFSSCIAFTVVIHIISIKIYIETVHWNWLSFSTGIFCLALYYVSAMVLNTPDVSFIFQPQITGEIWNACVSPKAYMAAVVLPMIALIPDITYIMFQKIFYPTPTDWVMLK
jgi:magnesium-transporting ATPase (P-type)